MDSSATESPLDVLSRAATMVQDNTFNTLPPSYDEARMLQRMKPAGITTPKNRRMREYTTGTANKYHHSNKIISSNNRLPHSSEPLDYSTPKRRERGSPPSYLESVQKIQRVPVAPGHQPRRSVITSCAPRNVHSTSSTGGVSDPLVDAHFRRSLGEDYVTDDSGSALSVDDHFAKALGEDMWLKLQQMESEEKKRKRTNSNEVTTPTEQVQEISTNELMVTTTTCSTTEIVEQKTIQKSVLRHDRKV